MSKNIKPPGRNAAVVFSCEQKGNPNRKSVESVANYNTFGLIDTKTRKILLITSSARKCKKAFVKGHRIEVWNGNTLINCIYNKNLSEIDKYIKLEKQHIAEKQRKAELRNKRRKKKLESRKGSGAFAHSRYNKVIALN